MRLGKTTSGNRTVVKTLQGDIYRADFYIGKQHDDTVLYPSLEEMQLGVAHFLNGYEKQDTPVYARLTAAGSRQYAARRINTHGDTDDSTKN